ncbi:MAG TPA: RluA family pseudouridine synthase [Longimicrobiales bacterium]|nr:RluA family pseudouridine synthase [Longimicrobiales bacterium]
MSEGPVPDPATQRFVVEDDAGLRLDAWLAARLPDVSRSRAAQLVEEKRVLVNGAEIRKSYRAVIGDVVEVTLPDPVASHVEAESIPLVILFEDADLLVIDKPAGLVVHPAPGHRGGTLVNALLHHVKDLSGIGGVLRPGIVHRLDRDTSGLMIVAKNDTAHRRLSAALKRRDIRRIYTVAAWGHLAQDELEVDAPIGRSRGDRKKMGVVADGRAAVTRFRRIERWPAADLLHAELQSGRTHQIRVHLQHIGHAVVGDTVYGPHGPRGISGPDQQWARQLSKRVPRQFLHASQLRFTHPRTEAPMEFESPLPPDLAAAVAWVESERAGS